MTADAGPPAVQIAVKTASQNPLADRFNVAVEKCDVSNKQKLVQYRKKWMDWMSWYGYGDLQPNSIETQIHRMLFNDLTYRATVSVRASVDANIPISARSPTLAYLLDQGYVVSQVLSLQKLLDDRNDVISVKRLLKDVEKHRSLITREVYVAGTGFPYDYNSWSDAADKTDPMVQMWGIQTPGLNQFADSKHLHEIFDQLSGKKADQRTRDDVIPKSVFRTMDGWISGPSADEISSIRHNFIAHSADAVRLGSAQFKGVKFTQIDDLQRAIVRVARALTDHVLSIRIASEVVPRAPLGIFSRLDLPYSPSDAETLMHQRWDHLSEERNGWRQGILQDLTSGSAHSD